MRERDFINLPLGDFELSDGIYNYTLKKTLTDDNKFMYIIKNKMFNLSGESLCLFQREEYYYDDEEDRYRYGNFKYQKLSAMAGIGGLRIHSKDIYNTIYNLELKPRGLYKNL